MKTTEILEFYHDLIDHGFNDNEVDTLFDYKPINSISDMNIKDIKFAMGCNHNQLWSCKHPHSYGQECNGPCNNCTTSQIRTNIIICPICDNPVESGHCINKLCVNYGR